MEITGKSKMICLLGDPVEHSLSPQMHNLAFDALGLDYSYLAFQVREPELPQVLTALRSMGVRGANLTMPLKNAALPLCDRLSPAAELSGAVNTLVFEEDGSISGYTTDGAGFFRGLSELGIEYRGKKLTLFGTGGAGMAILIQAALCEVREVAVFVRENTRFLEKTRACIGRLMEKTSCNISLNYYGTERLAAELNNTDILINASNVGMHPDTGACILPDSSMLHEGMAVSDVIYSPRRTRLLTMAEDKGLKTMNGLGMLLYQGAEAFRLWTGEEMPVELVKERYFGQ